MAAEAAAAADHGFGLASPPNQAAWRTGKGGQGTGGKGKAAWQGYSLEYPLQVGIQGGGKGTWAQTLFGKGKDSAAGNAGHWTGGGNGWTGKGSGKGHGQGNQGQRAGEVGQGNGLGTEAGKGGGKDKGKSTGKGGYGKAGKGKVEGYGGIDAKELASRITSSINVSDASVASDDVLKAVQAALSQPQDSPGKEEVAEKKGLPLLQSLQDKKKNIVEKILPQLEENISSTSSRLDNLMATKAELLIGIQKLGEQVRACKQSISQEN